MKYNVIVNKKFSLVRSYRIVKSVKGNTNFISKAVQGLVDKYIIKKQNI